MDSAPNCIWLVSPPGTTNSLCFTEVAQGLAEGFAALGRPMPVTTDPRAVRGRALVLNSHLLGAVRNAPGGLILYNLEQVEAGAGWFDDAYLNLLRRFEVWDYSPLNIERLAGLGVRARLCEIGYAPGLTRIPAAPARDLDVVFVGSFNRRRYAVLEALHKAGKNVAAVSQCFGAERDALYARAKIVINIHLLEAKIFEIVRCSYLLANRICVVSETGADAAMEAPVREGIAFAPYERLVETCLALLEDEAARTRIAEAGFRAFTARPQAEMLRRALLESAGGANA